MLKKVSPKISVQRQSIHRKFSNESKANLCAQTFDWTLQATKQFRIRRKSRPKLSRRPQFPLDIRKDTQFIMQVQIYQTDFRRHF